MSVEPAGMTSLNMVLNKSFSSQGEALIQLLSAFNKAVRAQAEPLANIADVSESGGIDVKA